MNFLDGHLYPENQPPLIITAAPYAPGAVACLPDAAEPGAEAASTCDLTLQRHLLHDDEKGLEAGAIDESTAAHTFVLRPIFI